MPKTIINALIPNQDGRDRQFSCELEIENRGSSVVNVMSITPRIPAGIEIQEIQDTSIAKYKLEHEKLCKEIGILIDEYNLNISEAFRKQRILAVKATAKELLKPVNILNAYVKLILGNMAKYTTEIHENVSRYSTNIYGAETARTAKLKFVTSRGNRERHESELHSDEENLISAILDQKIDRLDELETTYSVLSDGESISSINAADSFRRLYVFMCKRGLVNSHVYTLNFDCAVEEADSGESKIETASVPITVSPNPSILSIIAILGAVLGVVLKEAIKPIPTDIGFIHYIVTLVNSSSPRFLAAIISAFIFFNIYEHTELGKKLGKGISWRSALFIGSLCGLLNDKIVAAMTGLITG